MQSNIKDHLHGGYDVTLSEKCWFSFLVVAEVCGAAELYCVILLYCPHYLYQWVYVKQFKIDFTNTSTDVTTNAVLFGTW